jgi:hypothetical protein
MASAAHSHFRIADVVKHHRPLIQFMEGAA